MNNKAARFVEETRETADRWKESIGKADGARIRFAGRYGYLLEVFDQTMDQLSGEKKDRRSITTSELARARVPLSAWNSLTPIPGPSPEWYKTPTHWNASADVGHGAKNSTKFISWDSKITQAGIPARNRGDIYKKLGWPIGSAD